MEKIQNYIGGSLTAPKNGRYFDNVEPATGKVYCQIPDSDLEDVELAVKAAEEAQDAWANLTGETRHDS